VTKLIVIAEGITRSRPDYSVFENNCQNFVRFLIEAISPHSNVTDSVITILSRQSTIADDLIVTLPGAYPRSVESDESLESYKSVESLKSPEGEGFGEWAPIWTSSIEQDSEKEEETTSEVCPPPSLFIQNEPAFAASIQPRFKLPQVPEKLETPETNTDSADSVKSQVQGLLHHPNASATRETPINDWHG
jgi:hypothetical protein